MIVTEDRVRRREIDSFMAAQEENGRVPPYTRGWRRHRSLEFQTLARFRYAG